MMKMQRQNNEELVRLREEEKKQEIEANIVHKSKVKKPSALKAPGTKSHQQSSLVTMIKSEQKSQQTLSNLP